MATTAPGARAEFTAGLRQLADYLDANPGVPVPSYGATIVVSVSNIEQGGLTEIFAMSVALAAPLFELEGVYRTERKFGPITYKGFADSAAALASYEAQRSYYGCVTPDD